MSEEQIFFHAQGIQIEGLLENLPGDKGVIIAHPHPLYGGDMHNNVVDVLCRAFKGKGYGTLRFNFRGVGQSEGQYDNGIGEQDDVKAAVQYLSDLGKTHITLAGYSFGAWVVAHIPGVDDQVERLIMVSPPVDFMDFTFLKYTPKLHLVIAGTKDEFGPADRIEEMLPAWNPQAALKVIQGADHFYWGKTQKIQGILHGFLVE
ncbi:MAG: alpha/beta hydrolase [Deltaproteobacteria bacterium]|nr:alpha/beta hydrolase [Deltaproteobacteria bacterium]